MYNAIGGFSPMANAPDPGRVAAKWQRNAGNAGESYQDGVQNPTGDWQANTQKANENWKAGVKKAADNNRFSKGVGRVSTQQQIQASVQKGPARYTQGIAIAGPAFAEAIAPVLATIAAVQLPARKEKGNPDNIQRVAAIAKALNAAKLTR